MNTALKYLLFILALPIMLVSFVIEFFYIYGFRYITHNLKDWFKGETDNGSKKESK